MAKNTNVTTKKKYESRGVMTKSEYEQQRQANPQATAPSLVEMYQAAQDEYDAQKRRNYATMQAGNQIMTNLNQQKSKPAMQMELGKQLAQLDKSKGTQTKARKLQLTRGYMDAAKGIEQKKPVDSKAILPDEQVRKNYTDRLNSYLSSISKKTPTEQYAALDKSKKSSWLNPSQSKELTDIVGVDAARKYINDNPYDLAGKQKELETWREKKAEAEDRAIKAKADLDAQRSAMTKEEIEAAKQEAWNLKGQLGVYTMLDRDGLNVSYRDTFGEWHNNETITKRPDDYYEGTLREDYDALLYDKIHGDGAYMQRIESLQNDIDVTRLENEMDDLWNRLEHHTLHAVAEADQYSIKREDELTGLTSGHSTEQRAAESEARYAKDQIKNLENEVRFLQEYEDLMGKYATPEQVGYIPENDRGQNDVWGDVDNPNNGIRTNDVHRIYSFANKGKEFVAWAPANRTPRITDEYSCSLLMNDNELAKFNGYYNNQQYKEASAFLQALQPYLKQRYSEFSNIYTQENAKIMPVTSSAAAQAFMAADTVTAPIRAAASIFDQSAREADSAWYQTAKQADIIQQTIANDLGGTAGKAYLSFMNSLRNVINATMTKGLGATEAIQKVFGLSTFASQIFQESTYKYLKETHNNYTESIGLAALDAVMETLEEMLPYEAMLNTSDRPVIRLVKNMLSEAGEEFTGATVGEKIRGLVTGRDNVQQRADEIFNQGGYYDESGRWIKLDMRDRQKALNTADMQALHEWKNEIVENTIGGAAGGGFGSVYGSIANRIDTAYKGREIKNPSNTENGKSGAQRLYEIAMGMDENTKSRKLADRIKTTEGQVQKVGDYQLGRLAKAIAEDTGNKYNETIKGTVERDAKSKLMDAGIPEGQARIYADVIARDLLSNKAMSKADIQTLAKDRRAIDVYRRYTVLDVMSELQEKVKQETKPQNSIMETITRMVTPQTKGTSAMASDVDESIAKTNSPAEALDYLMTRKANLVTERFAKKAQEILEKNESARNSKNYVDDAMKVMLAAKSLDPTMPKVQMDEAAAQELYDEARKEFEEKDAERIKAQQPAVEGEGVAEYDGAEYGTDAWKEKVQGLNKTARNQMGAIGEIATRLGLRVKMINDTDNTNVYGYEMSNGTIYLNVAGLNRNKMSHHMLVTMAHEMTHWLEQNSLEGYKDLRQFALDNLRKEGKDVAQLMMKTIENHNRQLAKTGIALDMNGAMAEVIAKSCENILSSQEMINTLQDINPSLYNKVKSFVRNFVARVNAAIEGMDPSLSEEAKALRGYTEEIAKRWLTARKEAMGRTAPAEGQEPEEGVQFRLSEEEEGNKKGSLPGLADLQGPAATSETQPGSSASDESITKPEKYVKRKNKEAELDREYLQAIKDGNIRKQLQMIREKFANKDGIYPFYAPERYAGEENIRITKAIKEGDMEAISKAAVKMAKYVPDNAVLIPMPGHTGIVNENTDTMLLAKELSRITGAPVLNALEGSERKSRFASNNRKAITAEVMGMRQVKDIPAGYFPMIIDNVVSVGETAKAAIEAIPGSSILSFAKGKAENVTEGLKAAFPTKDKNGNWIPLSKKGDINNPNWRFSVAELSDGTRIAIEDKNILDNKPADKKMSEYIHDYLEDNINKKEISEATSDVIYLGNDLPHEYISSQYTKSLLEGNRKKLIIKNRAAGILLDAIVAAENKTGPSPAKHNNKDAKYGVYKYTTRIAFPVKNREGEITNYNAYSAQMIVNYTSARKLELYDIIDIKKDNQAALKMLKESADGFNYIRQPVIASEDTSRSELNRPTAQRADIAASAEENISQEKANSKSFSVAQLDEEYSKAVENGNVERQQALVDQAAEDAGYTIKAYHGTGRADRVGTVFLPERATSGPMAYFTDSRSIAENYARDKKDTSIAYDETYGDYHTQFRYNLKGKDIPVSKLWDRLDWKSRQKVIEAAKHINFDDDLEEIIYDEDAKYGPGGFTENELRYHRGNAIDTLIYVWLDSANLMNREQDFLKVLDMAGIKNVKWNNPDARDEKVYDVYLKIQNPFDTSKMYTQEFVDGLLEWWDDQDQEQYDKESMDTDFWDKNNVTVEEWAENARQEIEKGNTHNFTRIPDAVSDYLRSLGYDGIKDNGGKGGGDSHTVWIPFSSEQIKSADAMTYDNEGNVIKPSERFNTKKTDIRWSIQDESPDYDVERFMRGLSESSLKSEQEKTMFRQWKQINQTRESYEFFISDLESQIRKIRSKVNLTMEEDARHAQLTAKMTRENLTPDEIIEYKKLSRKAELSVYDRQQISKKQALINEYKKKIEKVDKEYVRVTRNDGYARLMQRNRNLMDNLLNGVTADQLQSTVRAMENQLNDVAAEMSERRKQLDKLAEAEAVLRIRTQFNRAGLRRIASELKNNLGSDLDAKEIENKLALIALKMKQGQMDTDNVQELADLLLGGIKTQFEGTFIDALRGSTITLGKTQLKELKGQGSSLSEVRDILAGTGIRVGTTGNTTLDEKWNELCDLMPSLDRQASPGDQLDEILKKVKAEKRESGADIWTDENKMRTAEAILTAANNLLPEIIRDEKSQQLIKEVMQYVHSLSEETKGAAQGMTDITALIDRMKKSSRAAVSQADTLTGDINVALDYYNKLSLQSEAAMWKEDRIKLIEQMKSDSTKALLEERDKWMAKIQKDKTARETMADNMRIRKSITTNISRLKARLINETDQKNITEHMKNLARELLGHVVDNDLYGRKITGIDRKDLLDIGKALGVMDRMGGSFTLDDLKLIHDEEAQYIVENALADLEDGIREYNDRTRGKDIIQNLNNFHNALSKIYNSVTAITNVISAENSINYMDRTVPLYKAGYAIKAAMSKSRFKGELAGKGSKTLHALNRSIILGNTTPEYFFKNLRNQPISELWDEAKRGENRNGLELQKAKDFLQKLAADTHYADWANETREISLGGQKTQITIGNVMELYAIWRREMTENPEMSSHIEKGGVYFENNANQEGLIRRENTQLKARRLSDAEIMTLYNSLTKDQQTFLDKVVGYLSNDMSKLGNEASMRMYGIEKYKETYYFPMKIWDGVRSARSDKGITGSDENRAAHKSWSKRRINFASNPLVIGDFVTDAVNHIVEMINYNTMAPAIENMNKVLNLQLPEIAEDGEEDKRNVRIMFQEAYGRDALNYLETLLNDMNGGVTQDQRKTLRDILLSTFKKNAVAGSLSVAAQQPLSYIRAAMLINPIYLGKGLASEYFTGAYKELLKYSGVAVLKQAGKFDMNFGSSAKEYIMPEAKEGKVKAAINWIGEKSTALPEKMDAWTWTRMWAAVKAEQHAANKNMDVKSDAFLEMCAERFNELMRRTQVYDSVLVKSSNMRSKNYTMKVITSFMAEPTLSLNVLADAFMNIKEKGGKVIAAKALATFALSAAAQAGAKALFSSGRSPDKKKTWAENYLYKLAYNLISEANPLGLIPGYSSMIDLLTNGELNDNSMSVLGKAKTAVDNLQALIQGGDDINLYRKLEDSVGQLLQLASDVPVKNLMRDFRAMVNIFSGGKAQALTGNTFAQRETSNAVLKYQLKDLLATEDLLGLLNQRLGEAGYQTSNAAYYGRLYEAMKDKDQERAGSLKEYLQLGKGVKDETITENLKKNAKADESLTTAQQDNWMIDNDLMSENSVSTVTTQYKEGKITKDEAKKLYKRLQPELTENDLWWKLDQLDYNKETGSKVSGDARYYRLKDAVNDNKGEKIRDAVKKLLDHGVEAEKIKSELSHWKSEYLAGDVNTRSRIREAIRKAYQALGLKMEDADKVIDGWKKEKKKTTK